MEITSKTYLFLCSKIQYEVLKKLSKNSISLSVVGDPNQSIYAWLYLDVDNLIKFSENFNCVKDFYFKENFRTTKEIAKLANKLIMYGPDIVAFKNGPEPQIMQIESYSQINDIIKLHNSLEYGSIGIIARTKSIANQLNLEFNSNAQYLFKNELILSITGLAEYILYGTNSQSVLEYLKYTNKISSDSSISEIRNKYYDEIESIAELKKNFLCYTSKKQFFLYLLGFIKDDDKVLRNIDFDKYKTLEDIHQYLENSIKFDDDSVYFTNNSSNILFTTAHSSKGSEFDTVILILDKFDVSSDESIRLLYVAITRAKRNLYIVYKEPADSILNLLTS